MRVILRYELRPPGVSEPFRIMMPRGARILKLSMRGATPSLWVEAEHGEEHMEQRAFVLVVTGAPFRRSAGWMYIDSFLGSGMPFVGHVYEIVHNYDAQ